MLQKAVHMLAMGSEAARSELGPDNTIAVSLEKQLARKERVLQDLNARSRRRESARSGRGDWTGRKSTNRATGGDGADAAAAAAPASNASGARRAGSATRYRSPRTAGNGGRSPIRRPASARTAAPHRAGTASPGMRSTTPRAATARRRPHTAHPGAPVPRVGAQGVTQPTPPPASRARPASAGVVAVGYGGPRRTGIPGVNGRPASAYQPGQRGQGRSGGRSAAGLVADGVMDAQFHAELDKLRGKIENEKLVTPEFLQTINDCAQHYYFTNSNAQYRATKPPPAT